MPVTYGMAKRSKMTPTQLKIWRFVRGFQKRKGYPPRGAVVAEKFSMSRQGADAILGRLVTGGHMRKVEDVGCWLALEGE
jgi:hypothetical protein